MLREREGFRERQTVKRRKKGAKEIQRPMGEEKEGGREKFGERQRGEGG